ncbi:MAG: tripartite tricarboxylate transporter TctB family protein [Thermodesulfobacteriota bacterium]
MTIRARDNLIFGGITIGCVAFLMWIIPAETPPYPGYGVSAALLPNVAVVIILVLSVLSLVRNLIAYRAERSMGTATPEKRPSGANSLERRVHLWHLARFMIPCLLLMPAMEWAGFIPAGLVFMLLIQYLCGQRKPVPAALVAAVLVGVFYVAMRYGLGVPMP